MPVTLRAATFNLENLFSRAKVLNLEDKALTSALLDKIAELGSLIGKPAYSPSDKTRIVALTKELSTYIEVREDRGKLFTGSGPTLRVTAAGRDSWDGGIEFKRAEITEMARKSTAEVVKSLRADVLCSVEIENRGVLSDFNRQTLGTKRFTYPMLIDGNDPRGIDVGLLTRYEISNLRTHIFDRDSTGFIFSRDCLEVEMRLADGRPVHILCNHLKSKGYGSQASSDAKRLRQSKRIAQILGRYNLAQDLVIVAGDMNDTPGSNPLQPLLSLPNLTDILTVKFANASDRWTYKYRSQLNQIDYLLVSKPLRDGFKAAGIERRGIFGLQGVTPFKSVTSAKTSASDHAAVWAEFQV